MRMKHPFKVFLVVMAVFVGYSLLPVARLSASELSGPLRVSQENPRYFEDGEGRLVYLTGSHTWDNLQDISLEGSAAFDYDAYLDFLTAHNHNLIRLWAWEQAAWAPWTFREIHFDPLPYERTGPGNALDGGPKFDLERFNEAYFDRLRQRVIAAQERGIYVMVMLFQGFSIEDKGVNQPNNNPWQGHPFNEANNINGVDGDLDGDGQGHEIHTLQPGIEPVTALQEAYVRKVIDTLNDLDNVLWDISNQSHPESSEWQYHIIDLIHRHQATKPKQHPVAMTWQYPAGSNEVLWESAAEAISPGAANYANNPPPTDDRKVVILDTDHIFGCGGDGIWIWKTFVRGYNPIYMDPYEGGLAACENHVGQPHVLSAREAMGQTRDFAERINLLAMTPQPELCSLGYCLASGEEYLVYLPSGGSTTVDLSPNAGTFVVEWFNPSIGESTVSGTIAAGQQADFTAPFGGDAVLYLYRQ